jgi:hypothetical protein
MGSSDKFREFAADCVEKAGSTENPEEKNLHLNMALAWVRLADQSEAIGNLVDSANDVTAAAEASAKPDKQTG